MNNTDPTIVIMGSGGGAAGLAITAVGRDENNALRLATSYAAINNAIEQGLLVQDTDFIV
jgi:hypothetical protein